MVQNHAANPLHRKPLPTDLIAPDGSIDGTTLNNETLQLLFGTVAKIYVERIQQLIAEGVRPLPLPFHPDTDVTDTDAVLLGSAMLTQVQLAAFEMALLADSEDWREMFTATQTGTRG